MANKQRYRSVPFSQFVVVGQFNETVFNGGTVGISVGYSDHAGAVKDRQYPSGEQGRFVQYVLSKDDKGRDVPKRFKFTESLRRFMTRPSDVDIYGKSQYEFLKNHPSCEGSPNGHYEEDDKGNRVQVGIQFRELNTAKDAEVALQADKLRVKAETSVLNLDEQTLTEVANILGIYGEPDSLMRLRVAEWSRKQPAEYMELLESGDRALRAIVRRALNEGIFTKQGTLIKWETVLLGSDENHAIATINSNPEMLQALQEVLGIELPAASKEKVKKTPVSKTSEPTKRGPGRPKKVTADKEDTALTNSL